MTRLTRPRPGTGRPCSSSSTPPASVPSTISRPVQQVRESAIALGREQVPPPLRTGVAEVDEVGAALHSAGVRFRHAELRLEAQVAQAVEEAQQAQSRQVRQQAAQHRLSGSTVIILHKIQVQPGLLELPCVPAFHEKTPFIAEHFRLNDQGARNSGIENFHPTAPCPASSPRRYSP